MKIKTFLNSTLKNKVIKQNKQPNSKQANRLEKHISLLFLLRVNNGTLVIRKTLQLQTILRKIKMCNE